MTSAPFPVWRAFAHVRWWLVTAFLALALGLSATGRVGARPCKAWVMALFTVALVASLAAVQWQKRLAQTPAVAWAAARRPTQRWDVWVHCPLAAILWLAACLSLLGFALLQVRLVGPGPVLPFTAPIWTLMAGCWAAAAALLCSYVWPRLDRVVRRWRMSLFLVIACLAYAQWLTLWPPPPQTVAWHMQRQGGWALLHGQSPYSLQHTFHDTADSLADSAAVGSAEPAVVQVNPYPPLSMLMSAAALLIFADTRWALLVCTLIAAWAMWRLGQQSRTAELAAVVLLFEPHTAMILHGSWTEPLTLMGLTLTASAVARWREQPAPFLHHDAPGIRTRQIVAVGVAAALLLASRHDAILLFAAPLLLALPQVRERYRAAALAVAAAGGVALPFIGWDWHGFWRGAAAFQLEQLGRPEALSWPAAFAEWFDWQQPLPAWPALALLVGFLVCTLRPGFKVAQALTVSGAALLLFTLLQRQAVFNHYWLVMHTLLAAAICFGATTGVAVRV